MKIRTLFLVLALVVGAACGGNGDESGPAAAESVPPPGDTVTGIVTSVESEGLNEVTSFTVKTKNDVEYEFLIDPELNYGFPLGHLEEHRVSADPVEVSVDDRDGTYYATSIDDA